MNNSKRILFSTENISWGGSELLWSKTVLEMTGKGLPIAICVAEKLQLPEEILLLEKEKKIILFKFSNSNLSFSKRLSNRFLPYRKRFKSKNEKHNFILAFEPDLIVLNQGFNFNGVDTMAFLFQNKINYVTISHAVNEGLWPNLSLRKKMRLGFENSIKNYFVSKDNLLVTQNQLGFILDNAEVIFNPFNVPIDIAIDFPKQDDFHLAFVGRYDFYAKGQDVLLQVLSNDKWKSRNLKVNFYGAGSDLENLKDLIAMYDLNNVYIHSHTETVDIWKMNQGLILTSRFEGLPIVIVEAMLCKRFVIVTDVSGNIEFVSDNQNGFIAAAPRTKYVDEALERAWQERLNWGILGVKARKEIVNQVPENPALVFANKLQSILIEL